MRAVIDGNDDRILVFEQESGDAKRRRESEALDFDAELQGCHQ
jgi:hypothetical protein